VTVQGVGRLRSNYAATIINAGTIDASTSGLPLTVDPTLLVNTGAVKSTAGILSLPGMVDNTAGVLDLGTAGGGAVSLSGTVKGGTLQSSGMVLISSNGTLDGVTIGSNLTQTGSLNITNGITLANGVMVDSSSSDWLFGTGAAGLQHIAVQGGTGTATINKAGGNLWAGYTTTGQTLQIDSGVTVQGWGALRDNYAATLINAGTIDASASGQTLTVNPTLLVHTGAIKSTAGTLSLPGMVDNTAGVLDLGAPGGGAVTLSGTVKGGTLQSSGMVLSTSGGTLDGVTIGSNLTQTGDLKITNGITLANGVHGWGATHRRAGWHGYGDDQQSRWRPVGGLHRYRPNATD